MAIKERKQITGTTAQINAYEGHEGQIVWDKDKKTFVGMSGTAGKNYPLAPQAYVDNEVSKVNAEVAKKQPQGDYATNTQLTEGLAGKEDKGVCLPLTGGTMSGSLLFNTIGGISQAPSTEYDELIIFAHDQVNNWKGGLLSCRGHRGSNEAERGSFVLGARLKDGSGGSYLLGTPAGRLEWMGAEVLRIVGAGDGWIRLNPNLQICFGKGLTTSNGSVAVTFDAPFSKVVSVTSTIVGGSSAAGSNLSCLSELVDGTHFNEWVFINGVAVPNVGFTWCAFGYY